MNFLCDICACGVSKLTTFEIRDHKRKGQDIRKFTCDECNKEIIQNEFVATWEVLRDKFGLSESLKIHIIKDHLFDTFESLLKTTDEITEATHSALRIHDERHGY